MIRILIITFILSASAGVSFLQGTQSTAQLIDELRTGGMNCEEGFAKLDSYFNELNSDPQADGVIVIYGDAVDGQAANRREKQLRNFAQMRRFDRTRLTFLHGSAFEDGTTQFWLVPPGADRPEVSGGVRTAASVRAPSGPYLYAADYSDGIPGCFGDLYDVGEYSNVLQSDAMSTARIVIRRSSQTEYRRKMREIVAELGSHGIARDRILTVYKYVRPNRLLEVTELWVIPSKRITSLIMYENAEESRTHRCPQGGLAWLYKC